jgi:hypothetical protein
MIRMSVKAGQAQTILAEGNPGMLLSRGHSAVLLCCCAASSVNHLPSRLNGSHARLTHDSVFVIVCKASSGPAGVG